MENTEPKKKVRRRHSRQSVRFGDLMVGKKYQTKTTGQLVQVVALDVASGSVTYKALSTVVGVGAGRAAAAGEVREVSNGHQWVGRLREIPREEVAAD